MRFSGSCKRVGPPGRRGLLLLLAASGLVLVAAAVVPARAQAPGDARWLPWLGCWESVAPAGQTTPAGPAQLCVQASPGMSGVTFATLLAGKVVSRQNVVADGVRRPIAEGGCTGWQSATWSADGHRLFRHSEMNCGAGNRRTSSGVLAFLPQDQWVEVDASGVGRDQGVRVARYRAMSLAAAAATGLMPRGEDLAIQTARTAASAPLRIRDVVEASRQLDSRALQALVYERGNGYGLDARRAEQLADARVPSDVIDLMVALSYPDFFDIGGGTPRLALREPGEGSGGAPVPRPGGPWGCYAYGYPGYGYAGYGYPGYGYPAYGGWSYPGWIYSYPLGYYGGYDPCYGPMVGWGGWGGWYGPYGGVAVVRDNGSRGGKVVKGKGFVPPEGVSDSGRKAHPRSGSSGSSGSVGRVGGGSASVGRSGGGERPTMSPEGRSEGRSGGGHAAHPRGH